MKKYYLIFFSLMFTSPLYTQEFAFQNQNIIGSFVADGKTQNAIFDLISIWISKNYGNAREIVQLYDRKNGHIIIRGINKATCRNPVSAAYPQDIFVRDHIYIVCMHTMEFKVSNTTFSIKYTLDDVSHPGFFHVANKKFWSYIRLDTVIPENVAAYNLAVNSNLKTGMMGKTKRDLVLAGSAPMFEELRTSIVKDVKILMESVSKTVNEAPANWRITGKKD